MHSRSYHDDLNDLPSYQPLLANPSPATYSTPRPTQPHAAPMTIAGATRFAHVSGRAVTFKRLKPRHTHSWSQVWPTTNYASEREAQEAARLWVASIKIMEPGFWESRP